MAGIATTSQRQRRTQDVEWCHTRHQKIHFQLCTAFNPTSRLFNINPERVNQFYLGEARIVSYV